MSMERYTYFDGDKWRLRIGGAEYSGLWVNRLAAYEDTGLEPEQVMGLCDMARRAKMADLLRLEEYQALGAVEELTALVKALDEGRVVMLDMPHKRLVWGMDRQA